MRILLLSAYDALSHRQWREGLAEHLPEHRWTVLTLPPRHFSWRIRGNALSWARSQGDILSAEYDLVLATSTCDLATLRGLVPQLARVPNRVYFHENQFAYPASEQQRGDAGLQLVNIHTALAADAIAFNSCWNRDSFFDGVQRLLARLPDQVPAGILEELRAKATLLPVGLSEDVYVDRSVLPGSGPLRLLWNHRWEYDKGPERLLLALRELQARGIDFRIDIAGQDFRRRPEAMDKIAAEFPSELDQFGHLTEREDYLVLLKRADFVLSTALHDFQGLAVLEATAAGCIPLAPDRLAYPEWLPAANRYPSLIDDPAGEARALAERLLALRRRPSIPNLRALHWEALAPRYQAWLAFETVEEQKARGGG